MGPKHGECRCYECRVSREFSFEYSNDYSFVLPRNKDLLIEPLQSLTDTIEYSSFHTETMPRNPLDLKWNGQVQFATRPKEYSLCDWRRRLRVTAGV